MMETALVQSLHSGILMKTSLAVAVGTVFVLAAGMPFAQDTKAPVSNPHDHAAQSVSAESTASQKMGQMDEHMKKMQVLHAQIASATTPEERQKAMDEQRKEMQAGMDMMNQMHGGGMMGGMGSGMMAQKGKPSRPERSDADDAEAHGHDANDDADDDGSWA
jgi:hypothetical protein